MKLYFLVIIILLAAFLRFISLNSNPPSLTWDEVAWGYNAYSLGIDLKDEFGTFLPFQYLESFGDYKPPVYAYLSILPVMIFGLNEFSTRFASAFFGTLSVLITYFLVKRIFFKSSQAKNYALLSALLLAISPWHINLSRAAFEANIASFFIITGVWTFLAGTQNRKWFLVFSIISFILSLYTFNSARVVTPVLLCFLVIVFYKNLLKRKKESIIALFVGIILTVPLVPFLLSPKASLRFKEVNIFSDIGIIERTNKQIENDNYAIWSKIIHNRRLAYGGEFIKHYFDHFNPNFLFIKGDGNPKFSTQDVGQLFFLDFPFLIFGALLLFRKKENFWWIIPVWMLIGILPAATARETPHALRIENTLPTFHILVAYGLVQFFSKIADIKKRILKIQIKYILFISVFLFFVLNFLYYFHGYHVYYPKTYSGEWQYVNKEAAEYIKSVESKYESIYMTESLGRPYIYVLFYANYDPVIFRKEVVIEREAQGFINVRDFGKYHFRKNIHEKNNLAKGILYINTLGNIPYRAQIKKTFHLLNGSPVLVAYEL